MPRVTITVPEKNAQPYRFRLDRKVVSLGRGSENDIVIDSSSVSGKHAEMRRVESGYELADLGSTNGIKHDGVRKRTIPLRSGMSVKLGDVVFDFSLTEEEREEIGNEPSMDESPVSGESKLPIVPKEKSESRPEPRRRDRSQAAPTGDGGLWMIVLFLILASAAFFVGLSIRHHKETGESLWKSMAEKAEVQKAAPGNEKAVPPSK